MSDVSRKVILSIFVGFVSLNLHAESLTSLTEIKVQEDTIVRSDKGSTVHHVVLKNKLLGTINLMMRKPNGGAAKKPVVFMLDGVKTGMSAIDYIGDVGDNIVVVYDYPIDQQVSMGLALGVEVLKNLPNCLGQITGVLDWLARDNDDIRSDRINIVAVSFGSFVIPLSLRSAQALGVQAYATVFAFGGSGLINFIDPGELKGLPVDPPPQVQNLVRQVLQFLDPDNHLPYLKGRFLVIRGKEDRTIPAGATMDLYENLPQPKEMIDLPYGHINVDQPETIDQTLKITMDWLKKQNAIN